MDWTRLVLVRLAASLYSDRPLKHDATSRQWCPNPDHYPNSELASQSLTLMLSAKQSSRASNFNVFCSMQLGIEPPTTSMPGERSTTTLPGRGTRPRTCPAINYPGNVFLSIYILCFTSDCTFKHFKKHVIHQVYSSRQYTSSTLYPNGDSYVSINTRSRELYFA